MTTEELFTDLKQFIVATISQQMANVATKDDLNEIYNRLSGLSGRIDILDRRMDVLHKKFDVLDGKLNVLDEKVDLIHDAIADAFEGHERRIQRLEHRTV